MRVDPGPQRGRIGDGATVMLEPVDPDTLQAGDIVLVRVRGTDYLHLVKAVNNGRYLIGNNRSGVKGWDGKNCIFGVATKVE